MEDEKQNNGFTIISHALIDALNLHKFTTEDKAILEATIRYSYGCGYKSAFLSPSEFVGISRTNVLKTIKKLVEKRVLYFMRARIEGQDPREVFYQVSINPDISKWNIEKHPLPNIKRILHRNINRKNYDISIFNSNVSLVTTHNRKMCSRVRHVYVADDDTYKYKYTLDKKEREKKDDHSPTQEERQDALANISLWNKQEIYIHKNIVELIKPMIDVNRLHGKSNVAQTILNYSKIYHNKEEYFSVKYTLYKFLKPDIFDKFTPGNFNVNDHPKYKKPKPNTKQEDKMGFIQADGSVKHANI